MMKLIKRNILHRHKKLQGSPWQEGNYSWETFFYRCETIERNVSSWEEAKTWDVVNEEIQPYKRKLTMKTLLLYKNKLPLPVGNYNWNFSHAEKKLFMRNLQTRNKIF